ncbi:MAG TPA: hypothetical protein VGD59_01095 [Acidisarcina sp.]
MLRMLLWMVRQIFLDCDGVLADFDSLAIDVFGRHPREAQDLLGTAEFWRLIQLHGEFYRDLPIMAGAIELYEAVAHLNPIILTGCPRGGWSEPQKVAWAAHHFPGVRIITCPSKDKYLHMLNAGDVLVDDYLRYKDLWLAAGGVFVHHVSAEVSIHRLADFGLPVRGQSASECDAAAMQNAK